MFLNFPQILIGQETKAVPKGEGGKVFKMDPKEMKSLRESGLE
jgi:hypothetical protein